MAEPISISRAAKLLGRDRKEVTTVIKAFQIKTKADPSNAMTRLITSKDFDKIKSVLNDEAALDACQRVAT